MIAHPVAPRILYWIMCAAPAVQDWREAARQLQEDGWDLHAIPTQTAASWLDLDSLADVTGHAVRTRSRLPHETDELPPANAVLVAPATFNTLNQWAAGINDTLPLGLLNELLGLNVPIVVAMYCKAALASHPAYRPNIRRLNQAGATVLDGEHSITVSDDGFSWTAVRATLGALPRANNPIVTRSNGALTPPCSNLTPTSWLRSLNALSATADDSILLGDSPRDVDAAHQLGIATVGYANKRGKRERLAHAAAVIIDDLDPVASPSCRSDSPDDHSASPCLPRCSNVRGIRRMSSKRSRLSWQTQSTSSATHTSSTTTT